MIYYTSDLHLGHKNIIRLCNRPFADADEMDNVIIAKYNSVVTDSDTVYILGDVSLKKFSDVKSTLALLKGTKHLILGNHDRNFRNNPEALDYFASISNTLEINDGGRQVILSHCPMLKWNGQTDGSIHVHGHIHNNINDPEFWSLEKLNAYNAGVEVNGYMPVTLEQLAENKKIFYAGLRTDFEM